MTIDYEGLVTKLRALASVRRIQFVYDYTKNAIRTTENREIPVEKEFAENWIKDVNQLLEDMNSELDKQLKKEIKKVVS